MDESDLGVNKTEPLYGRKRVGNSSDGGALARKSVRQWYQIRCYRIVPTDMPRIPGSCSTGLYRRLL